MMNDINAELIKNEIQGGLEQVDNTLTITDFNADFDRLNRHLKVKVSATNEAEETIEAKVTY